MHYIDGLVAGSFKYIVIGGVVFGIMAGTIGALSLGGSDRRAAASDAKAAETAKPAMTESTQKPQISSDAPKAQPVTDPVQMQNAEAANDAGKQLLYEGKYAAASVLFREAVARAPDPKFFVNLATSLFQEGKFDETLIATHAILGANPTPRQRDTALKLTQAVVDECHKQKITCHPSPELEAALAQLSGSGAR